MGSIYRLHTVFETNMNTYVPFFSAGHRVALGRREHLASAVMRARAHYQQEELRVFVCGVAPAGGVRSLVLFYSKLTLCVCTGIVKSHFKFHASPRERIFWLISDDRIVRREHQVVDAAQLDAGAHAAGTGLEGHVHRRAAALVHCCLYAFALGVGLCIASEDFVRYKL